MAKCSASLVLCFVFIAIMRLTVALSFVLPAQVLANENTETPDYTIVGGSTINAVMEVRTDAARRSYGLVAGRTNLKDFTHTLAEKLTWRDHRGADGVQMRSIKGGDRVIQARGELSYRLALSSLRLSLRTPGLEIQKSSRNMESTSRRYCLPLERTCKIRPISG
jgi:hypothetical protein